MATLADLNVRISASIDDFEAKMATAQKGIGRLGDAAKQAGQGLSTYVTLPLGLLAGAAVAAASDMQRLEKGFAATYKGSEDLSVALGKVRELAKLPGLGLKEALQGATNLQAAGFSADLATRALGAFGNALATVGKGKADLNGVGLALSQIASKGKISAEEINQLAERVPQIRQAMQAAFGTADTEVLQNLKISATDFVEGVTAELSKLPKVTGGIGNAFENLQDAGTVALSKLGDSLNKAFDIEGNLGKLADFISGLAERFAALEPGTQTLIFGFGAAAAAAGPLLFAVGAIGAALPAVTAGFSALGITSLAALGPVGLVVAAVAAGALLIYENWDKLTVYFTSGPGSVVFNQVAESASQLGSALSELRGVVSKLLPGADGLGKGFSLGAAAMRGLGLAVEAALFPLRALIAGFSVLADAGGNAIRTVAALLRRDFKDAAAEALTGLVTLLNPMDALLAKITEAPKGVGFSEFFKDLLPAAAGGFGEAGSAAGSWGEALKKSTELTDKQTKALEKLKDGLATAQIGLRVAKGLESETPEFKLQTPGATPFAPQLKTLPVDTSEAKNSLTDFQGFLGEFQVGTQLAAEGLNASLAGAFSGIAQDVGRALAEGTSAMDAFGAGLIKAFAALIVQFGEKLILLGIGNVAAQNYAVGAAQLAAGGLLVGSGAYVAAGGLTTYRPGGPAGGPSGASIPKTNYASAGGTNGQPLKIEVTALFKIDGRDLVALANGDRYRKLRTA